MSINMNNYIEMNRNEEKKRVNRKEVTNVLNLLS